MTAAEKLTSRKLLVALAAILAIAVCPRLGWALSDVDVKAIENIAMSAIGGQALIDLLGPALSSWLSGRGLPAGLPAALLEALAKPAASAPAPTTANGLEPETAWDRPPAGGKP